MTIVELTKIQHMTFIFTDIIPQDLKC